MALAIEVARVGLARAMVAAASMVLTAVTMTGPRMGSR